MRRWVYLLFAAAAASGALSSPAFADRYDEHWYHGPIHEFHAHDLHAWRGGHWYHGYYGGRGGWYWIVGGVYYWYPQPVYPYPDPYLPPEVAVAPGAPMPAQPQYAPPPSAPPAAASPPVAQGMPPAAPAMWYYCDPAKGYYPYVPSCPIPWRPVPAQPTPP